jgi:3-phenylpropionate/cinnamic acid dioxygenase small subunit
MTRVDGRVVPGFVSIKINYLTYPYRNDDASTSIPLPRQSTLVKTRSYIKRVTSTTVKTKSKNKNKTNRKNAYIN